jgi:hypothetical protein
MEVTARVIEAMGAIMEDTAITITPLLIGTPVMVADMGGASR